MFKECDSSESYDTSEIHKVRSDLYFVFNEDTTNFSDRTKLGLKIRDVMGDGRPLIELKVRSARDKTGMERWSKAISVSFSTFNADFVWEDYSTLQLNPELIEQVKNVLKSNVESVYEATECLQLLDQGSYTLVRVDKKRSKQKEHKEKIKYSVEEVNFKYEFPVTLDGDQKRMEQGYIFSVALEGSSNVLKVAKDIVEQYKYQIPQGYPAFLSHVISKARVA